MAAYQRARTTEAERGYPSVDGETVLLDWTFEVYEERLGWTGIRWEATTVNTRPYFVKVHYQIDFRDARRQLVMTTISPGDVPMGAEPRKVQGVRWLSSYAAERVDFDNSSVSMRETGE